MLRILTFVLLLMGFVMPAKAGETVTYKDGDVTLEGYLAKSEMTDAPIVMIVHQWKGLGAYEKERADMLSKAGYNAFAIDMYGQDIRPSDPKDAGPMAGKYKSDPELSRKRLNAALTYAKTIKDADTARIGIMGYCFGGTMALELARSGADIKSAISFHGALATKAPAEEGKVKASIAVYHGADDPHVPQTEVSTFRDEMNAAKVDWTFSEYAGAVHAFTEKAAGNDPSKGAAYNEKADKRSWSAAMAFLEETLGK